MSMHTNSKTLTVTRHNVDNLKSDSYHSPRVLPSSRSNTFLSTDKLQINDPVRDIYEPVNLSAAFHEQTKCDDLVTVYMSQFPGAKEGDIAELTPIEGNQNRKLLFVVKPMSEELARRSRSQVSIGSTSGLQPLLGISTKGPVSVRLRDQEEVEADLIEILVRDIHLNRGDMWELSSLIRGTCVFKSQKFNFLSTIRLSINSIYRFGKKKFSGYIGDKTKIVFRSESARLVFLIQITEEMYHFQEDGEVMFHKVINSLFPSIFKRWREEKTHHLITIVFAANVDFSENSWNDLKIGERPKNTKDYYRVVVDQINIVHWNQIMISLRYEFQNFRKEIIDFHLKNGLKSNNGKLFLPTIKSDILNTINLSTTLVVDRFRDPDLKHTTNHFIVISAGNGLFDVEYEDLLDTGKRLVNTELSVDIICLTAPPLHATPLFRYRDSNDKLHHCVPGWIDVSYWIETSSGTQWLPSCKIYELQMMGIMENDINDVTIESLKINTHKDPSSIVEFMDNYDKVAFGADQTDNDHSGSNSTNKSLLGKKLQSNPSLRWKLSKSAITTIEPSSAASPIFSVSKTAIDSLQEIANPQPSSPSPKFSAIHEIKQVSDSSSISSSIISNLRPRKFISSVKDGSNSSTPIKPVLQKLKTNATLLSSSPGDSNISLKEKTTAFDSLKTVMWTEIENISKRLTNLKEFNSLALGKWQHVFPESVKRRTIKWRSLLSPSELPVTTPIFPSVEDFESNFQVQNHSITLSQENEKYMTSDVLFRQMIHFRLMMGFQICYGAKVKKVEDKSMSQSNSSLIIKYLPEGSVNGARIYLSLDEEIHRIYCDLEGVIHVRRYNRFLDQEEFYRDSFDRIMIKTRYQHNYHTYDPDPLVVKPKLINWNKYDQLLAGYEDDYETKDYECEVKVNRAKFVLLPLSDEIENSPKHSQNNSPRNPIPGSGRNAGIRDGDIKGDENKMVDNNKGLNNRSIDNNGELLSEEEIRVEGLRKLILSFHRGTFKPGVKTNRRIKEEAFDEIKFYTGDLIRFIEEGGAEKVVPSGKLLDKLLSKDLSLDELADVIRNGALFTDRRWHQNVHMRSFLGMEFVTWLVDNFSDLNTREQATDYAVKLMNQGLFYHVNDTHGFLDGHYFYKLCDKYEYNNREDETLKSRSNSVGSKTSKLGSMTTIFQPNDGTLALTKVKTTESALTKNSLSKEVEPIILSRSLKLNLDPQSESYQPEILTVHYDTVHNPAHCFHIRLEWLTTTPKLIEDTINGWSRMCGRYGLRLVETPWNEVCEIPKLNPFHSYVDIALAIDPWDVTNEFYDENIFHKSKFYYHIYLLEHSGFLMDNRASKFFQDEEKNNESKADFEIAYSWGKPKFKFAQYIHRTGAYIAEITDTGDLFLAPNNTHIARVNMSSITSAGSSLNTPGPIKKGRQDNSALDSQKIMLEFRKTCLDERQLKEMFTVAKTKWYQEEARLKEEIKLRASGSKSRH